ncbi:MAG TPA: T9SS type A sorting domain-containing protein [Flavipsychrobacter sp.]|nr:T9SS type A sorting domain-containing protein [Flavipsychrobacter sp.]
MKKFYSFLFALAAASPFAVAKTTTAGIPNIFPHMGSGSGNSAAANYSRILGYTYLKHNGTSFIPVDSTTYSYSFGRGGLLSKEEMDDNFVNFDHSYTYEYLPATNTYQNLEHRFQAFNGAGKASKYTRQVWSTALNSWEDKWRYVYNYNNDLTLLQKTSFDLYIAGTGWAPHVLYNNFYDNVGNVLKMRSTAYVMTFTYDGNNNMLTRIDSQANISPFYWYGKEKFIFTYDANNRVISYIVQQGVSGNWVDKEKFEHVYTGNNITQKIEYQWSNNTWELKGRNVSLFDANNNVLSDEVQYWDVASNSYKSVSKRKWTYNNFNQPLTYHSETFETSTNSWSSTVDDFFYRYYYQSYIPASVNDLSSDFDLKLFPQPARNELQLELLRNYAPFSLSVYDVQGRLLKQEANVRLQTHKLNVSNFQAGTYFLKINLEDRQLSKQFIVVK